MKIYGKRQEQRYSETESEEESERGRESKHIDREQCDKADKAETKSNKK